MVVSLSGLLVSTMESGLIWCESKALVTVLCSWVRQQCQYWLCSSVHVYQDIHVLLLFCTGDNFEGGRQLKFQVTIFMEGLQQKIQSEIRFYQFLDDGIDSAWTTATKKMSPHELARWRRKLFSVYVGHLPYDVTKVILKGFLYNMHNNPFRIPVLEPPLPWNSKMPPVVVYEYFLESPT